MTWKQKVQTCTQAVQLLTDVYEMLMYIKSAMHPYYSNADKSNFENITDLALY